jgi:hypothetical protein
MASFITAPVDAMPASQAYSKALAQRSTGFTELAVALATAAAAVENAAVNAA